VACQLAASFAEFHHAYQNLLPSRAQEIPGSTAKSSAMKNDEALLSAVMKRQVTLSLRVAAVFIAVLLGLPLLNAYAPQLAGANIGGFSLTWLILGVLFYPLTWVLSRWFITSSDKIEEDLTREYGEKNR
jgi:uncharacterized membrane protein (DUF485 family)